MSIASMVGLNIERQWQSVAAPVADAGPVKGVAPGVQSAPIPPGPPAPAPQKTLDSAMEKITAFIPSEVIASYVAILGLISPDTPTGKWIIFAICLVLIPAYMYLGYLTKKKQAKEKQSTPKRADTFLLMIFAAVAFIAWSMALPGTPFASLFPRATTIGGVAVIIVTSFMYKVADLLDLVPKTISP